MRSPSGGFGLTIGLAYPSTVPLRSVALNVIPTPPQCNVRGCFGTRADLPASPPHAFYTPHTAEADRRQRGSLVSDRADTVTENDSRRIGHGDRRNIYHS